LCCAHSSEAARPPHCSTYPPVRGRPKSPECLGDPRRKHRRPECAGICVGDM
jgi:hypothetical protein